MFYLAHNLDRFKDIDNVIDPPPLSVKRPRSVVQLQLRALTSAHGIGQGGEHPLGENPQRLVLPIASL